MNRNIRASLRKTTHMAVLVLTVGVCTYTPQALACSCDHLAYGFIGPYTSQLPANATGIPWYVSTKRAPRPWTEEKFEVDEDRFTLEILEDDRFREIQVRLAIAQEFETKVDKYLIYHIGPRYDGLTPGATYRVTDQLDPKRYGTSYGDRQVVVEIDREPLSADTPLTLHLGTARVDRVYIADTGGSCGGSLLAAQSKIAARLPGNLRKWEHQLLFRTIVDGVQWDARRSWCSLIEPGRSWEDYAHDRIFATCEEASFRAIKPLLKPGKHSVTVEARLPGTDIVLKTATKSLDLECPDADFSLTTRPNSQELMRPCFVASSKTSLLMASDLFEARSSNARNRSIAWRYLLFCPARTHISLCVSYRCSVNSRVIPFVSRSALVDLPMR